MINAISLRVKGLTGTPSLVGSFTGGEIHLITRSIRGSVIGAVTAGREVGLLAASWLMMGR